jgi:hypothetical protein
MANESTNNNNLASNIALAIITLVASVGSGIFVFYLTDKTGGLRYSVNTSAVFTGKSRSISIAGVRVINPDKKEVEEVRVVIPATKNSVSDFKVVGLQPNAFTQVISDQQIEIKVPYSNPRESFSVQILFSPGSAGFGNNGGNVSVRGKGVVAALNSQDSNKQRDEVLPLLAAGIMSLVFSSTYRFFPSLFYTRRHSGDSRDITSFLLGIHDLHEESLHVHSISRPCSYWALSDYITEVCINSGDQDKVRSGTNCLLSLLEYASFADTSKLIVNFNLSRMAFFLGDAAAAKRYFQAAREGGHGVIEKRISMDRKMSELSV